MRAKILILPVLIIAILFSSGCVNTGNIVRDDTTYIPTETSQPKQNQLPSCVSDYKCSAASECISPGFRVIPCYDQNNCGKNYVTEGYAKNIIDQICLQNSSMNVCQKNMKTITERCDYEASIGDKVTIGDFSYIVTDVMQLPYIGGGYLGVEAKGMFVILIMSVENSGKKSEYLSYNNFKLLDSKSREYETDTTASIYMSQMGYTPLPMFDKIGPGLTSEGGIVFDVPGDDTGLRLKISGGTLEGSVYIKIGNVEDL